MRGGGGLGQPMPCQRERCCCCLTWDISTIDSVRSRSAEGQVGRVVGCKYPPKQGCHREFTHINVGEI